MPRIAHDCPRFSGVVSPSPEAPRSSGFRLASLTLATGLATRDRSLSRILARWPRPRAARPHVEGHLARDGLERDSGTERRQESRSAVNRLYYGDNLEVLRDYVEDEGTETGRGQQTAPLRSRSPREVAARNTLAVDRPQVVV
jgi:hypothetical protein